MPRPAEVAERVDPITGPFAVVRLLGDRDAIEKITTTWEQVVIDRADDLQATAEVIPDDGRASARRGLRQQPLRQPLADDRPRPPDDPPPSRTDPAPPSPDDLV